MAEQFCFSVNLIFYFEFNHLWITSQLFKACIYGHSSVVKILLEKDAYIDAKDDENKTPLFYGKLKFSIDKEEALFLFMRFELLLINNEFLYSNNLVAVKNANEDIVELLVKNKANLKEKYENGWTLRQIGNNS